MDYVVDNVTWALTSALKLKSEAYLRYTGFVYSAETQASVSRLHHQTWEIHCGDQNQFARSVSMVIQFVNAHRKKWGNRSEREISSATWKTRSCSRVRASHLKSSNILLLKS
jgi:hypothetical protein